MEKINIAEILKDCPCGMELDCPMFENLEFNRVEEDNGTYYIIGQVKTEIGYNVHTFTKHGCYTSNKYAKCVIFPKGKTTWEGFVPPCMFKDGDIIYNRFQDTIGILMHDKNDFPCKICDISKKGILWYNEGSLIPIVQRDYRLATEEEKEKLFQAIKDNGLRWNSKTKTLEVLIVPKFKVGDKVKCILNNYQYTITELTDTHYTLVEVIDKFKYTEPISEDKNWELVQLVPKFNVGDRIKWIKNGKIYKITKILSNSYITNYLGSDITILFNKQDEYELVHDKFDVNTLVPFESKVLVRDVKSKWLPAIWGFYNEDICDYHYVVTGGQIYRYCIPYEGNEHLLATTNDCSEFYKIWE